MSDKNRQHRRIEKNISVVFCVADGYPLKWDMSVIQNIGAGGIKFSAPSDMKLKDKIIHVRIKIPELAPHLLELEAVVLDAKPRETPQYSAVKIQYSDIRAKFINITEEDKERLSIVERMVDRQLNKKN